MAAPSVLFTVDGIDRTLEAAVSATGLTWHSATPLPDGPHTIAIALTDNVGNSAGATSTVGVNTVPPTIVITPAHGSTIASASPLISVTYEAAGGVGIALATLAITLDGAIVAPTSVGAAQATYQVPTQSPLQNGPHTFTASIEDNAGNAGTALSTFTVSTGPPPVTVRPSEIFSTEQKTFIGNPLPNRFAITVRDNAGNPIAGVETSWQITDGTGRLENPATGESVEAHSPSGILLVTTDAQGQAVVLFFPFNESGTTHVVAFLTFFQTIPPVAFEAVVAPEAPEQFEIVSGNNQTVAPNSPVPQPFVVNLKDPNLNAVPNWGIVFRSETGGGHFEEVPGIIRTISGGEYGEGGSALDAFLSLPFDVEGVSAIPCPEGGNAFLIALFTGHRIVKVDENGVVRTVVGTGTAGFSGDGGPASQAQIRNPWGLAFDSQGNLYFTESQRVRKVDFLTETITTIAGTGQALLGSVGDGGSALNAAFFNPAELRVLPDGDVLVVDTQNFRVRRIDAATGIITTFAGGGSVSPGVGGPATTIQLGTSGNAPNALEIDPSGIVYIGTASRVCRVGLDGILTSIAGTGVRGYTGDGGSAAAAMLDSVSGLALSPDGSTLSLSHRINHVVRNIDLGTGNISTVAGTGVSGFFGDGGLAIQARLSAPYGLAYRCNGSLVIADSNNGRIRQIALDGTIHTIAGSGNVGDHGPLTGGRFGNPVSVARDPVGNLYVADRLRIRKIDRDGIVTTIAGNGTAGLSVDGIPAVSAPLFSASAVAVDSAGNVYFIEFNATPPVARVRRIDPAGILTTVAGQTARGFAGDGGPATQALLSIPTDVAVDAAGNIYIADGAALGGGRIRKVSAATGIITTFAGGGSQSPMDGVLAANLLLYTGTNAQLGIDVSPSGEVYIAHVAGQSVYRVDTTGIVHVVAGILGQFGYSGDGGPATAAKLHAPWDVSVDGSGNVFVGDIANQSVRRVDAATGIITRVAGAPPTATPQEFFTGQPSFGTTGFSGDGGAATDCLLSSPRGLEVDPEGNLFIADTGNLRLRRIASGTATSVLALTDATGTAAAPTYVTGPDECGGTVSATAPGASVGALTFTIPGIPPATPDPLLIAEANSTHVTLVWNTVDDPDVVGYRLRRGTVSGGPYPMLVTPEPFTDNFFTDTAVTAGQDYYYVVTAVKACGLESLPSVEAHAQPRDITTATVITSPPEGFETSDPNLVVTGTAEPGEDVLVFSQDPVTGELTSLGDGTADALGNFSIPLTLVAPGSQTLLAQVVDTFGNFGPMSLGVSIVASIPAGPPPSRCVTVFPACIRSPETGETPQQSVFTYTFTAPPKKAKIFIYTLSADDSSSFVRAQVVPPGATIVRQGIVTASLTNARMHPAAWCKGFFYPDELPAATLLKTLVQGKLNAIAPLVTDHVAKREAIRGKETELIALIENGYTPANQALIVAKVAEIDVLEGISPGQDHSLLAAIDGLNSQISGLYGRLLPERDSGIFELNLLSFRIDDADSLKFIRVPDPEEETPGMALWLNDDDDDEETRDDLAHNPVTSAQGSEDDLASVWWFFAAPVQIPATMSSSRLTVETASTALTFWDTRVKDAADPLPGEITDLFKRDGRYVEGAIGSGSDMAEAVLAHIAGDEHCKDEGKLTVLAIRSVDYEAGPSNPIGLVNFEDPTGATGSFRMVTDPANPMTDRLNAPGSSDGEHRLFPDKLTIADITHFVVDIRVTIVPVRPNQRIWIKSFDVDDPSENTTTLPAGPVDPDDAVAAPPNNADNRQPDAAVGAPWGVPGTVGGGAADALGRIADLTGANGQPPGEVLLRFNVQGVIQPGNNFRIVAGFTRNAVQNHVFGGKHDVNARVYRLPEAPARTQLRLLGDPPSQMKQSPLLTIWRRVHVERDSMARPGTNENGFFGVIQATNTAGLAAGETRTFLNVTLDEQDQYEDGRLTEAAAPPAASRVFNVVSFPFGSVINTAGGATDYVVVNNDAVGSPTVGVGFRLHDDDDDTVLPTLPGIGVLREKLARAYLDVLDDSGGRLSPLGINDSDLALAINLPEANGFAQMTAGFDTREDRLDDLWIVYIQSAFQPDKAIDFDRDAATAAAGAFGFSPGVAPTWGSFVFLETIRDRSVTPTGSSFPIGGVVRPLTAAEIVVRQEMVVTHELGHQFGLSDNEENSNIMGNGLYDVGGRPGFLPEDLDIIRDLVRGPGR